MALWGRLRKVSEVISDSEWNEILSHPWPEDFRRLLATFKKSQNSPLSYRQMSDISRGKVYGVSGILYWFDKFGLPYRIYTVKQVGYKADCEGKIFRVVPD